MTLDEVSTKLHGLRRLFLHLKAGGTHSIHLDNGSAPNVKNVERRIIELETLQRSLMEDMT
jgi:hypothetical protein